MGDKMQPCHQGVPQYSFESPGLSATALWPCLVHLQHYCICCDNLHMRTTEVSCITSCEPWIITGLTAWKRVTVRRRGRPSRRSLKGAGQDRAYTPKRAILSSKEHLALHAKVRSLAVAYPANRRLGRGRRTVRK